MNKYAIAFIISWSSLFTECYGQVEWAPIGAQYNYSYTFWPFDRPVTDLVSYIVKDEVMWNGKFAKQFECLPNSTVDFCSSVRIEYMSIEERKHYVWSVFHNEYRLLYDYSAQEGDSWLVLPWYDHRCMDSVICTVDSVKLERVNDVDLQVQYVTSREYTTWTDGRKEINTYRAKIAENIGNLWNRTLRVDDECEFVVDPPAASIGWLHCYIQGDGTEILFSNSDNTSCDELVATEILVESNIKLWPNPTQDYLNISGEIIERYAIYNQLGKLIIESSVFEIENRIGVSQLDAGIYDIILTMRDKTIASRFVKK